MDPNSELHKPAPRLLIRKHSKLGGRFLIVSAGKQVYFENMSVDHRIAQDAFSAGQHQGSVSRSLAS